MPSKNEITRRLAGHHYEIEPGLVEIYRLTGPDESLAGEPVKLLEVNNDTVSAGVLPLHFAPMPAIGIPFPSVIIEVTANELSRIRSGELKLPAGWRLGEPIARSPVTLAAK